MLSLAPGCVRECRGCGHRELSPEESLTQKTEWLERTLGQFGPVEPIRHDSGRWGYRRKSTLRCERRDDRFAIGTRLRLRDEDRVVPIPECPVHAPEVNEVFARVSRDFPRDLPLVYAAVSGELLILVLKCARDERAVEHAREWWNAARVPGVTGFYLNFHPSSGDRVFASNGWVHVGGAVAGEMRFFGRGFRHGPSGFMQVKPDLYAGAILRAREFLSAGDAEAIVDLYCGVGISLSLWREDRLDVLGVELSGEACEYARANSGAQVLQGKCSERLPQVQAFIGERRISVFANPPRTGLEEEVVAWLVASRSRVDRVAYLSCSAGTLARDLKKLAASGYRPHAIAPYDFFPGTPHVETLVLLT